jgi:uncharacterized protein YdcH (DUF465 family)
VALKREEVEKEVSPMEQTSNEELKAHLMATDAHFRSLIEEHALYHKQLEELESRGNVTLAEDEVEHRLKKQKLRLKDEINMILSRAADAQVA